MKSKLILIHILLTAFFGLACGQVTIGATEPPVGGAMLDLKENDSNGGVTAYKGLALPRVKLSDLNKLYPMFLTDPNDPASAANADYDTDPEKLAMDRMHTGLTVYNVNICLGRGVWVWAGNEWQPLGAVQGLPDQLDITQIPDGNGVILTAPFPVDWIDRDTGAIISGGAGQKEITIPLADCYEQNIIARVDCSSQPMEKIVNLPAKKHTIKFLIKINNKNNAVDVAWIRDNGTKYSLVSSWGINSEPTRKFTFLPAGEVCSKAFEITVNVNASTHAISIYKDDVMIVDQTYTEGADTIVTFESDYINNN